MNYTVSYSVAGAKKALQTKQGKCSEYAALMVALCKAKKISQHNCVEVYYNKYGRVMYDHFERYKCKGFGCKR